MREEPSLCGVLPSSVLCHTDVYKLVKIWDNGKEHHKNSGSKNSHAVISDPRNAALVEISVVLLIDEIWR